MKNQQQRISELNSNIKLNEDLIDAIVNLQDAGFGTNKLSAAQDEANMRISINQTLLEEYEETV